MSKLTIRFKNGVAYAKTEMGRVMKLPFWVRYTRFVGFNAEVTKDLDGNYRLTGEGLPGRSLTYNFMHSCWTTPQQKYKLKRVAGRP